jgi:CSLREA domain-containing protein
VNTTADAADASPGDTNCLTSGGQCSLRAAIQEANALAGSDSISVPAGTYVLSVTSDDDGSTDLDITGAVTINGAGPATIIDANLTGRAIDVAGVVAGLVGVGNLQVSRGVASTDGANGGGVRNIGSQLLLSNVTIDNNTADGTGIGGGGIYNTLGTTTIVESMISENTVGAGTASGGGIANDQGTVSLTNVTLSVNAAPEGGAIFNAPGVGGVSANNVTIAGSVSTDAVRNAGGNVTFRNSIIAGSTDANCFAVTGSFIISSGHNISSDATCAFAAAGDMNSTDPLLGPPADNGGPTMTHALLDGSPAINAGDDDGCAATDQRGISRPQGAHCDIGAFEVAVPLVQGDVDCGNGVNSVDALKVLRFSAGLTVAQGPACPAMGLSIAGFPFGDVDCGGTINPIDALKVLRNVAALPVIQPKGCTEIGQPFP